MNLAPATLQGTFKCIFREQFPLKKETSHGFPLEVKRLIFISSLYGTVQTALFNYTQKLHFPLNCHKRHAGASDRKWQWCSLLSICLLNCVGQNDLKRKIRNEAKNLMWGFPFFFCPSWHSLPPLREAFSCYEGYRKAGHCYSGDIKAYGCRAEVEARLFDL